MAAVEKTINAQNVFTDSIQTQGGFNFSLSGTFVGTITIQRSYDLTSPDVSKTWHDMETYTAPKEDIGIQPDEALVVRAGIKTGDYTSGSAIVRISR